MIHVHRKHPSLKRRNRTAQKRFDVGDVIVFFSSIVRSRERVAAEIVNVLKPGSFDDWIYEARDKFGNDFVVPDRDARKPLPHDEEWFLSGRYD